MLALLFLLEAAAVQPADGQLREAAHALEAGRLDQARTMVAAAMTAGAQGPAVERLLADLARSAGQPAEALARYRELLAQRPDDAQLLERAALAALASGENDQARAFAGRAVSVPAAGWRAWNALGVAADRAGNWDEADRAYRRAAELAPGRAEPLNNRGWSLLVRGEWAAALALLEQAAALDPDLPRLANNLQLARSALAADLPRRAPGESDDEWAARLNDAGVAASRRGERARAVAAFAQAIDASGRWYQRAANNLALLGENP